MKMGVAMTSNWGHKLWPRGYIRAQSLFLEITFYWSTATPSSYMVYDRFMVQSPVAATKPQWSINAKIFTIWLFMEHFLICDIER